MPNLAAQLGFKAETTWGTAVTVDRFVPLVSESLKQDIAALDSKGILAGARVLRSQQWTHGNVTVGGDLGLELYDRSIGVLFQHCLGSITTASTTAPYTWTITPGSLTGLGLTVQIGRGDRGDTVRPFTYAGCKVVSWELACAAGEIATMGLTLAGKSETNVTALASASYATGIAPMSFVHGSLALAGSSLCARNVKIAGDNKLDINRRCLGQSTIDEPVESDLRMYTVTADIEFPDLVHYNRYLAGTESALTLVLGNSTASSTATITANVRSDDPGGPNVKDRGLIVQTMSFSCVGTNNDSSGLSIVLTNSDSTP